MFEKIKERIKYAFTPGEEKLRSTFESKHEAASIARSEDGAYLDPAIEAEWQKDLAVFQEDIDRSLLR